MCICDQGANVPTVHLNSSRKRKGRGDGSVSVAESLAKWKEHNAQLNSCGDDNIKKLIGLKKGCMKGKGGPENSPCKYRGVWQRTWDKWGVEIRDPNGERFSGSVLLIMQVLLPLLMMKLQGLCMVPLLDSTFQTFVLFLHSHSLIWRELKRVMIPQLL
uniref:Uncharacterized protein n=1 Tax=Fagus sylvatica TaxID=28930 RepID=A0A2N9GGU7_FAGSY